MSKKGFEIVDHYRSLKRVAIAKKLGVSTKLFESVEEEEEMNLEETTEYGYDAKQEVGHEKKQGKQKPMQSIDEPVNKVGHRGPKVTKQGPNKHKEKNIKENEELEEGEDNLEETTEYGYDAKQEVGHEKKQGKQKPMQKIDTHAKGAGSADPGLRKKGGNKHKESGIKENSLNEAVNKLLKTVSKYRKSKKG